VKLGEVLSSVVRRPVAGLGGETATTCGGIILEKMSSATVLL